MTSHTPTWQPPLIVAPVRVQAIQPFARVYDPKRKRYRREVCQHVQASSKAEPLPVTLHAFDVVRKRCVGCGLEWLEVSCAG